MTTPTSYPNAVAPGGGNRRAHQCACLAGIAMLAVATASWADVYKSTDANGRVQYSDKPPGAAKAMIAAGDTGDLEGRWRVANTTMNGELSLDKNTLGATWTFHGGELLLEMAGGDRGRYTVTHESRSHPRALRLDPVPPSKERGGWMIYERDGERLRFAYMDNLEGRPSSFAPQPKLVVTTLITMEGAGGRRASAPGSDPCATLRAAGIEQFLGAARIVTTPGTPDPTTSCRIEEAHGLSATLVVFHGVTRSTLDRERAKLAADTRNVVQDEPALGVPGHSSARGNNTLIAALKGDTLVMLAISYPGGNREKIIQFARRVLAAS